MTKFLAAFLFLCATCASQLSAEIVALSSDHLNFTYRADDAADVGGGNLDLSYRGTDYGVSEAWFLNSGGSTVELTGGTVVDGADSLADEKVWTVDSGDLQFRINFYAIDEFPAGPHTGVSVAMNVSLFNNSTTEPASGLLTNYSNVNILGSDSGSLVASTTQDSTSLFTAQEDAIGLASYSAKRWNAAPLVGGSTVGFLANGWGMLPRGDDLLGSIRSGATLGDSDGGFLFFSDVTGAAQWEYELAPQTGIEIQSDLSVFIRAVPEPGSLVCLSLFGLIFCGRWRQK